MTEAEERLLCELQENRRMLEAHVELLQERARLMRSNAEKDREHIGLLKERVGLLKDHVEMQRKLLSLSCWWIEKAVDTSALPRALERRMQVFALRLALPVTRKGAP